MKIKIELSELKQSKNPYILEASKGNGLSFEQNTWRVAADPQSDSASQSLKDLKRNVQVCDQSLAEYINEAESYQSSDQIISTIKQFILNIAPREFHDSQKIDWLFSHWSQVIISLSVNIITSALMDMDATSPIYGVSSRSIFKHSINIIGNNVLIISRVTDIKITYGFGEETFTLPGEVEMTAEVTADGFQIVNFIVSNCFLKECFFRQHLLCNKEIAETLRIAEDITPESIEFLRNYLKFDHFGHIELGKFWYAESQYSLSELESHLNNVETFLNKLQPLRNLLSRREQRILRTDIIYPHFRLYVVNYKFKELADKMAPYFPGVSAMQLLLPSIEILENEVTGTHLKDLQLHEFVISESNTRFIEVGACLDFAANDGELKHTSLYGASPQGLTKEEKERVINHSKLARTYYDKIRDLVREKTEGTSLGTMVNILIADLRRGGVHGGEGGKEMEAGHAANVGINNFNLFLKELKKFDERNNGTEYNLCLMSDPKREPFTLYIKSRGDDGLEYQVIGLNNELTGAIIPWKRIREFPRNESEIIKLRNQYLPRLLDLTSYAGHTHPTCNELFNCSAPNFSEKFKDLWIRISEPGNYKEVIYCVELIADKLETLLECNQWLFNIKFDNTDSATTIGILQERCKEAKNKFETAFSNANTYEVTASYGSASTQEAAFMQNFCVTMPLSYVVALMDESGELIKYLQDNNFIAKVFKRLTTNECITFITDLKRIYHSRFLLDSIKGVEGLATILNAISIEDRSIIIYELVSVRDLYSLIKTPEELIVIILLLPEGESRLNLITKIQPSLRNIFNNGEGIGFLLACLKETAWPEAIYCCLESDGFALKLSSPQFLAGLFSPIDTNSIVYLLHWIVCSQGKHSLNNILTNQDNIQLILSQLTAKSGKALLTAFIGEYGSDFISELIKKPQDLIKLQKSLPVGKSEALLISLLPYLTFLSGNLEVLISYISQFKGQNQIEIIKILLPNLFQTIKTLKDMVDFMKGIDERKRVYCLRLMVDQELKNSVIGHILSYPTCLETELGKLPLDQCSAVLSWLGPGLLNLIITEPYQLSKLLDQFERSDQLQFIRILDEKKILLLKSIFTKAPDPEVSGFTLVEKLRKQDRLSFLILFKRCFNDDPQVIEGWQNIARLTATLTKLIPEENRVAYIVDLLGRDGVIVRNEGELASLLSVIPIEHWARLLQWLDKDKLKLSLADARSIILLLEWRIRRKTEYIYKKQIVESAIDLILSNTIDDFDSFIDLCQTDLGLSDHNDFIQVIGYRHMRRIITNEDQLTRFFALIPNIDINTTLDDFLPKFIAAFLDDTRLAYFALQKTVAILRSDKIVKLLKNYNKQQLETIIETPDHFFKIIKELKTFIEQWSFLNMFSKVWLNNLFTTKEQLKELISELNKHSASQDGTINTIKQYVAPKLIIDTLRTTKIDECDQLNLIRELNAFISTHTHTSFKDKLPFFAKSTSSKQAESASFLIERIAQKNNYQQILDEIDGTLSWNKNLPQTTERDEYTNTLNQLHDILINKESIYLCLRK